MIGVKHAEKTPDRLLVLDDLALFSPDFEEGLPAFVLKFGCLGCAYGSNFLRVTQATVKAKPKMSGRFRNSKMFAARSGLASSALPRFTQQSRHICHLRRQPSDIAAHRVRKPTGPILQLR